MIQVNRIYLIFNRLVTKKFLVDTSVGISDKKETNYYYNINEKSDYSAAPFALTR